MTTTQLPLAPPTFTAAELYVGVGNTVAYRTETGLLTGMVVAHTEESVEVAYHVNTKGQRTSYPDATSERRFEWVPKTDLSMVNDTPVRVTK